MNVIGLPVVSGEIGKNGAPPLLPGHAMGHPGSEVAQGVSPPRVKTPLFPIRQNKSSGL